MLDEQNIVLMFRVIVSVCTDRQIDRKTTLFIPFRGSIREISMQ